VLRRRDGRPYTPHGFGTMWQKLQRKALKRGVIRSRFKFHDLRAMAATEKADIETEEAAQQLLGHTDVQTTRRNYIRRRKPRKVTPVR
jgi:integrase